MNIRTEQHDPIPDTPVSELDELVVVDDTPIERIVPELPLEADAADVLEQRRGLDDDLDDRLDVPERGEES